MKMETKQQKYYLMDVVNRDGKWMAMIGDPTEFEGGLHGLQTYNQARKMSRHFNNAAAAVRTNKGIHFYTLERAQERLEQMEKEHLGADADLQEMARAVAMLNKKEHEAPVVKKQVAAALS